MRGMIKFKNAYAVWVDHNVFWEPQLAFMAIAYATRGKSLAVVYGGVWTGILLKDKDLADSIYKGLVDNFGKEFVRREAGDFTVDKGSMILMDVKRSKDENM